MYHISAIGFSESTKTTYHFDTPMIDHSIDNLIQSFIKECVKKGENSLPDDCIFVIERNKNENIALMVWMTSSKTGKPALSVLRKDRESNMYFYSPQGKLLNHRTHT
jgi:hypothetical protein